MPWAELEPSPIELVVRAEHSSGLVIVELRTWTRASLQLAVDSALAGCGKRVVG
jgi:hypothetical protein